MVEAAAWQRFFYIHKQVLPEIFPALIRMIASIPSNLLTQKEFSAKTLLISEGNIANELFFIHKGSIRAWFNNGGKETTLQFFFDNDYATSLESFLENTSSTINIETMDTCQVSILQRHDFFNLLASDNEVKEWFYAMVVRKLITHFNRLLSLLKNKPFDRYQQLLAEHPEILQKVPQRYIASYLGITPVSLSRIRGRNI